MEKQKTFKQYVEQQRTERLASNLFFGLSSIVLGIGIIITCIRQNLGLIDITIFIAIFILIFGVIFAIINSNSSKQSLIYNYTQMIKEKEEQEENKKYIENKFKKMMED